MVGGWDTIGLWVQPDRAFTQRCRDRSGTEHTEGLPLFPGQVSFVMGEEAVELFYRDTAGDDAFLPVEDV